MTADELAAHRELADSFMVGSGMTDDAWRVLLAATKPMAAETVRALAARRMTLQPGNEAWRAVYWPRLLPAPAGAQVRASHLCFPAADCTRRPQAAARTMAHELAHLLCRHGEEPEGVLSQGVRELTAEAWAIRWGHGKRTLRGLRKAIKRTQPPDETSSTIERNLWWLDRQQSLADRGVPVPTCALTGECPALIRMGGLRMVMTPPAVPWAVVQAGDSTGPWNGRQGT